MDAFQRYYKDKIFEDHRLVVTASFAFCVITFEPIEVQTRSAPQNDGLNLSFVKDIYVDAGTLARNGRKKQPFTFRELAKSKIICLHFASLVLVVSLMGSQQV